MSSYTNQDSVSAGNDIIYGRAEDHPNIVRVLNNKQDVIDGLAGNDIIIGDLYSDQVSLTEDVLKGGTGDDWLFGDTVNFSEETLNVLMNRTLTPIEISLDDGKIVDITGDTQWRTREYSNTARDELYGGDGNDHLFASAGSDVLRGGAGNDYLDGGIREDDMAGETGSDTYFVDNIFDRVSELNGSGFDTVIASVSYSLEASTGVERLFLAGFNSRISGTGNWGNNELDGSANTGANNLTGLGGNDKYIVGGGDTVVEATDGGTDTVLAYQMSLRLVNYRNIENATILNGDFNLEGNNSANRLTGSDDANFIEGNKGKDILTGHGGDDTFSFDTALSNNNVDRITDFTHVDDLFQLDNAVFAGLRLNRLSSSSFQVISSPSSTTNVDANDYILYDKRHGDLYFDRDGSGTHYTRVKFADVDNNTAMDNTDFFIV